MYQTIFIKFLQINQIDFNITSEIEKLSSIYKFNIKKILNNNNGSVVEININNKVIAINYTTVIPFKI